MVVDVRREIVHAAGDIYELPVSQTLAHLLDGSVDVTQVWIHLFDGFPVNGDAQVQHAMRRGMLWSHVHNHVAVAGLYHFL